jgi:hypothetical protein
MEGEGGAVQIPNKGDEGMVAQLNQHKTVSGVREFHHCVQGHECSQCTLGQSIPQAKLGYFGCAWVKIKSKTFRFRKKSYYARIPSQNPYKTKSVNISTTAGCMNSGKKQVSSRQQIGRSNGNFVAKVFTT